MQMKYNKQHYFTEIINVWGSIVSHNEMLPQDEITYLQTVHDLFVKVDDWLKGYHIENTADELALDMIKGGNWVGISEKFTICLLNPLIFCLRTALQMMLKTVQLECNKLISNIVR